MVDPIAAELVSQMAQEYGPFVGLLLYLMWEHRDMKNRMDDMAGRIDNAQNTAERNREQIRRVNQRNETQ